MCTFGLPVDDWIFDKAASPLSLLRQTMYTVAPLKRLEEEKDADKSLTWENNYLRFWTEYESMAQKAQ